MKSKLKYTFLFALILFVLYVIIFAVNKLRAKSNIAAPSGASVPVVNTSSDVPLSTSSDAMSLTEYQILQNNWNYDCYRRYSSIFRSKERKACEYRFYEVHGAPPS